MKNKTQWLFITLQIPAFTLFCQAESPEKYQFKHPVYIGGIGGFGSTTWNGLVPAQEKQNAAILLSTPISASEGGRVWGVFGGYEITPYFALEGNYMQYPNATVRFDDLSLFSYVNDLTEFTTETEAFSFQAKVMLVIPNTKIRFYSSLGGANVHRKDLLNESWRLSPSFGAGLNYHFTERVMGEIAGNYTAGFGESDINPTDSYIPFLYSFSFRLAYCFF